MAVILSEILEGKQTVAIGGHMHPDGDCTGSCLGLYMYLLNEYPDMKVDVYLEEIPQSYHLIEKIENAEFEKEAIAYMDKKKDSVIRHGLNRAKFISDVMTNEMHLSGWSVENTRRYLYIKDECNANNSLALILMERIKLPEDSAEKLSIKAAYEVLKPKTDKRKITIKNDLTKINRSISNIEKMIIQYQDFENVISEESKIDIKNIIFKLEDILNNN